MLVKELTLYQVDYWTAYLLERETLLLMYYAGGFWEAVVEEYRAAEPPAGFQGIVDDWY